MKPKHRLRLKSLKFVSAVDNPCNEHSVAAIIKRAAGDEVRGDVEVVKVDDELGIVIGFANVAQIDGAPYYDLDGETVDETELVKIAAEYAESGAAIDEMHDGEPDAGKTAFLFPLTSEIAKALGISTKKTGLLIGVKCAPDVLAKFRSGVYRGWSIAGYADREPVEKALSSKRAAIAKQLDVAESAFDEACAKFNAANGLPRGAVNAFLRTEEGTRLAAPVYDASNAASTLANPHYSGEE